MCGSRKYPYLPHEGICRIAPLPSGFFQDRPQNLLPLPSGISKIFCTLLWNIEVNKVVNKVVLLARMPNFVSFMYFLLNCITDRQILMPTPYALKSQTNFVSFMYFLLNSTTDKRIPFALRSWRNCWKSSWPHENLKKGREGNITVLFTHCTKKKARLEEV